MNTMLSQVELSTALRAQYEKIAAADRAGRSTSTMNRLWRRYFQIEDALKAYTRGGF